MVERLLCMQEVLGSIPRFSSFFSDIVFDDSGFCSLSDKDLRMYVASQVVVK